MPELLRIETADFELSIWCRDISRQSRVLSKTLAMRADDNDGQHLPVLRFLPQLEVEKAFELAAQESSAETLIPIVQQAEQTKLVSELALRNAVFFENTQYQFEWVFFNDVDKARLTHRSRVVNDGFRFVPQRKGVPARLTGTIRTGNDVGWMRLPLEYEVDNASHSSQMSFEVLPTKMALHQDLPAMYRAIDSTYPLWRFSLVQKTEQDAAKGQQRGHFALMWLANFGQLREQFEQSLNIVCQAPHSRLQASQQHRRAERLKGRVPHSLAAQLKEDHANGQHHKRYSVEKKRLSVDTPENRFVKMAVMSSKKQLAHFAKMLKTNNQAPDKQRVSSAFIEELESWQAPLQKVLGRGFFKEVGPYTDQNNTSLVLQQKAGYSGVYRVWQELKFYLDVFASQSSLSMKSVAEIYEIWCFLSIKQMLQDNLGFVEVASNKAQLHLNKHFEYQLKDGLGGAFNFERSDGVKVRLAHEPVFTHEGKTIRSYLVSQKPDILLEVTLPPQRQGDTQKQFVWLFDAKYRVADHEQGSDDKRDKVPDDAINQMHRYRDALIRIASETGAAIPNSGKKLAHKSRPVFGAFALYPGYFDQVVEVDGNPYKEAIQEVGIGAFALLPNERHSKSGCGWLLNFLLAHIGPQPVAELRYANQRLADHLYVQDAARIPHYGMQQTLYADLTMTAALAGKTGRGNNYLEAFERGTAKWYHMPQETFEDQFKLHVVDEISYLALASTDKNAPNTKRIGKIWPVRGVTLLPRAAISVVQAGKVSDSKAPYYLFELGSPLTLQTAVLNVPHRPLKRSMKLTTLSALESTEQFDKLATVYTGALA